MLPNYFQSFGFAIRSDIHEYNTRNKNALETIETNTKLASNCIRHAIPKIINNTQVEVIENISTHSLDGFTWYIKQKFINSYEADCTVPNCYICQNI